MKKRANWLLISAMALGLGACGKKEEVKAPEAPAAVAEASPKEAPAPAPVAKAPKIGAEERAAKLGFAKHLPQDTEVVLSFYNGSKTADRVMNEGGRRELGSTDIRNALALYRRADGLLICALAALWVFFG